MWIFAVPLRLRETKPLCDEPRVVLRAATATDQKPSDGKKSLCVFLVTGSSCFLCLSEQSEKNTNHFNRACTFEKATLGSNENNSQERSSFPSFTTCAFFCLVHLVVKFPMITSSIATFQRSVGLRKVLFEERVESMADEVMDTYTLWFLMQFGSSQDSDLFLHEVLQVLNAMHEQNLQPTDTIFAHCFELCGRVHDRQVRLCFSPQMFIIKLNSFVKLGQRKMSQSRAKTRCDPFLDKPCRAKPF